MANLNICGGAYKVKAPISIQDCINLFPEVEKQGSKERIVLRRFPGLKNWGTAGSKIRGMEVMDSVLYVVSGTSLYSVTSTGTATSIGTVAGTNRVSMANDGTYLVIVNATNTLYVYTSGTLTASTPTNFTTADKVYLLDTYFIFHRTDTDRFFISNAGTPNTYTSTDVGQAQGHPDKISSIIVANRDLILFGEKTTEFWRDTGNTDFTFQRQSGVFLERGNIGLHGPVEMDNSFYFLGDDRVVYSMIGYRPVRISDHAIEEWLQSQSKEILDDAIGMTITYKGHYWYILSFSSGTWVYDSTVSHMKEESEWFQLKSHERNGWRVTHIAECYGKILCGDAEGNIYELDHNTYTENGYQMLKQRTTPYYHRDNKYVSCRSIELDFEEGVANSSVTDPKVLMEMSTDGGRTWNSRRIRSMGALGQYKKEAIWRRNGDGDNFVFRFYVTDNVDVTFTGAYGDFS